MGLNYGRSNAAANDNPYREEEEEESEEDKAKLEGRGWLRGDWEKKEFVDKTTSPRLWYRGPMVYSNIGLLSIPVGVAGGTFYSEQ